MLYVKSRCRKMNITCETVTDHPACISIWALMVAENVRIGMTPEEARQDLKDQRYKVKVRHVKHGRVVRVTDRGGFTYMYFLREVWDVKRA